MNYIVVFKYIVIKNDAIELCCCTKDELSYAQLNKVTPFDCG